jgi:type III restriction enzyme
VARESDIDDPKRMVDHRRPAEFITPIPKPKKRKGKRSSLVFDEGLGFSTAKQQYNHTAIINSVRNRVDKWRRLAERSDWRNFRGVFI